MKKALKITGWGFLFGLGLSLGLGIGQKTGSLTSVVFAQGGSQPKGKSKGGEAEEIKVFNPEVTLPKNPTMTAGSIAASTLMSQTSATDRLIVNGVDLFEWVARLQMHLVATNKITDKNAVIIIEASRVKYKYQ